MKIARQISVLLSTLCFISLNGCTCKKNDACKGAPKKNVRQEIRINIVSEPGTLDPRKASSLEEINLARMFMEGLMRVSASGLMTNALAENVTLSKDMKTYTFKLKDSYWSNGDPLTAHDFVYSWKKTLSSNFPATNAFLLYALKNGKAVKEGHLPSSLLGVHANDDHTLVINLESPTPFFLELLSLPVFFPVNERIDRKISDWSRNVDAYVSNGPFIPKEWHHNGSIVAIKNPHYWDKNAVSLNKIEMIMVDSETGFKMFQGKELDWDGAPYSNLPIDAIASLEGSNQIHSDPMLGSYWIRTNTALFPFHSLEIRKALALAIDRAALVEHVVTNNHIPATGIVPTTLGLQKAPYFKDGDTSEALHLLNIALENEGIDKENLPEITLTYAAEARNHRVAQAIQDQWNSSLGIRVQLEPLEAKVYFDRIAKGDYQLACGNWIADFADPINFLEIFKARNVSANRTNWESLEYQKALEASYIATNKEDRINSLRKSEEIIMEEMPVIPIFHMTMLHTQNDRLKEVVLTSSGHIDFKWAYLAE